MKKNENTFSFKNASNSTGFLLWQVTNLWQREIKKALVKFKLTHAQYVLLASIHWLTLHDEDVTQILLSEHTKVDPMTTSTVLRSLQTKGLLERWEHEKDTRAKTVKLTRLGIEVVKQAVIAVEKFDVEFFKPLGKELSSFNDELLSIINQKSLDN